MIYIIFLLPTSTKTELGHKSTSLKTELTYMVLGSRSDFHFWPGIVRQPSAVNGLCISYLFLCCGGGAVSGFKMDDVLIDCWRCRLLVLERCEMVIFLDISFVLVGDFEEVGGITPTDILNPPLYTTGSPRMNSLFPGFCVRCVLNSAFVLGVVLMM